MESSASLQHQLDEKRDELAAVFAQYPDLKAMPAEVAEQIAPRNDELTEIAGRLEEVKRIEMVRDSVSGSRKAGGRRPPNEGDPDSGSQARGLGAILRESKAYESFRRGDVKTASLELDGVEMKTLMTLTTINNPATRGPIVPMAQDETTVSDLLLQGTTDNNTLTYMEETTLTNNAATVAEGAAKPESALAFTERTDNVRKIATWIPATAELLADVAGIQSYIEGRLAFMVRREEEDQVLNGSGTAPDIRGILNRSGIQTQAKGADPIPDAVYKAITKIRVTGQAEPTAYVTHPNDWQEVRLLRTTDGIYIWGSPAEAGPERIWGLQVRQTPVIAEGTGLVGAFTPHGQIFRREGLTITLSTEHSTYFVENKVAILAELRLALVIYRPSAFCTVTGI